MFLMINYIIVIDFVDLLNQFVRFTYDGADYSPMYSFPSKVNLK